MNYCDVKKLTIEEMHKLAKKRGGKCLSDNYINARTKLQWECAEGHQWRSTPDNIKSRKWCPTCGINKRADALKLTIEEMHEIAKERGGKCLSDTYENARTKLHWECAKGHKFLAKPYHVKSGSWCKICSFKKMGEAQRLNIEEMCQIAIERGGKCLSETYENSYEKLQWECVEGHQWSAAPMNIKSGTWCPACGGSKILTIEEMHQIAKERGGKCLSDVYKNNKTRLQWECAEGHQWEAVPNDIKHGGTWCPKCELKNRGETFKLDIEEIHRMAKGRGGKCLSGTYENSHEKLQWECAEGHQWSATQNSIKMGSWCSICSSGFGERICREFFEQIFGKKFKKSYPKWLVSERGNQTELDGYCPSLKLAFEHQGKQHFEYIPFFHASEDVFQKHQNDDDVKRKLCKKHGVTLIEIPEVQTLLPIDELRGFIEKECRNNNISLPRGIETKKINLKNAYITSGTKEALRELQRIASERGGKCISDTYETTRIQILWECAEGHSWVATPDSINSGHWCPACGGSKKLTIEEMQQIAKGREGKCLSNAYENSKTKLQWECAEGHQWEASPINIKRGKWCPYCARNIKLSIEDMQKIAQERGGRCLSDTYINTLTKLRWECSKNHNWEATPGHIKQGKWCPYCIGKYQTIEDMQKIAHARGGKCLSESYINTHTKLQWECSEGHQWEAVPSSIKSSTWCPVCSRKRIRNSNNYWQ